MRVPSIVIPAKAGIQASANFGLDDLALDAEPWHCLSL